MFVELLKDYEVKFASMISFEEEMFEESVEGKELNIEDGL